MKKVSLQTRGEASKDNLIIKSIWLFVFSVDCVN